MNVLVSFAYHSRTDLADLRARLVCGQLMVDSGAFTAFTVGKVIRLGEYAEYLEGFRGAWDHAITLDKIGDPAATRANTRRLHARGIPVMPVFTKGDTLAEFDAMVRECRYVAVGGQAGMMKPGLHTNRVLGDRLAMLQRRALALGGGIHALGVGSMAALHKARPYSADTSTADSVLSYGNVLIYDGKMLRQVHVTAPDQVRRWRDVLTAHGIDVGHLVRAGRIPPKQRPMLMGGHTVAYAAADEVLHRHGVPAPVDRARPGTVLYIAPNGAKGIDIITGVDARLHSPPDAPPLWARRYAARHECPSPRALPGPGGAHRSTEREDTA